VNYGPEITDPSRGRAGIQAFVERLWQDEACMADPILFATKAIEQYLQARMSINRLKTGVELEEQVLVLCERLRMLSRDVDEAGLLRAGTAMLAASDLLTQFLMSVRGRPDVPQTVHTENL
jgi:hypothetical protein